MHDLKAIRENPEAFAAAMARRGIAGPLFPGYEQEGADEHPILTFDRQLRGVQTILQGYETRRNEVARSIGQAKRNGEPTETLEAEGAELRRKIERSTAYLAESAPQLDAMLAGLPNILDPDVPDGPDETANVERKTWGIAKEFEFQPRQHFEIGEALGMMDFGAAAKLAGSRFTVLRGDLARLERALGQFMLDIHTREHGYTEMSVPLLVNDATMYGTGQLPKFAEDLFRTTDGRWLIPTAEVPLTNLAAGEILAEADLPLRFTALTPSFRSEAGSAGRDTRGMLRQHQFWKVELVSITRPADSADEHERMTRCAETVLERLGLPYRRMLLCAGDTGFASAKTYDLEVWLPGQGMYREISSCSNCLGFQARRMNARYRPAAEGGRKPKPDFVHTLNGSGVAVGRALIAVLETCQNQDGSVTVPEPLRPYLGGQSRIAPAAAP